MQSITIIAALTETTRVIGRQGQLPWHLPEDLQRFKALTLGHPIIMGRTTWELGLGKRILPHRHNIVVSRSLEAVDIDKINTTDTTIETDTTFQVVRSLPTALTMAQSLSALSALSALSTISTPPHPIFIIGGASIYAQTLPLVHRLELTLVHADIEGDAFFPPYQHLLNEFDCVAQHDQPHTTPPSTYISYERRGGSVSGAGGSIY